MSGTALGAVFDYVLTGFTTTLATAVPTALVIDSWATDLPPLMFVFGRARDDDQSAGSGTQALNLLGAQQVDEEFVIPFFIDCYVGGSDQKEARDAALAIWDSFVAFIAADRTLGGALTAGRYARLDPFVMDGPIDADEAGQGRRCVISGALRCQNLYAPTA